MFCGDIVMLFCIYMWKLFIDCLAIIKSLLFSHLGHNVLDYYVLVIKF